MKLHGENYKILQHIAAFSFEECYAGLNILLYNDSNFKPFVERSYRLQVYDSEGEFYMTTNERFFHTIGFIDAIIWMERSGYFLPENGNQNILKSHEIFGENSPAWNMLNCLIAIVERGDDVEEN